MKPLLQISTDAGTIPTLDGTADNLGRSFMVAIGKAAQRKHEITVGDELSGVGAAADTACEVADLYKVSKLKVTQTPVPDIAAPPVVAHLPSLDVYRERDHRRLSARTYASKCSACIWGAKMAVEIIVDKWKPYDDVRWRVETFCYGPKSCKLYKAGPTRKVPGRKGMSWEEGDYVDRIVTEHRGEDE